MLAIYIVRINRMFKHLAQIHKLDSNPTDSWFWVYKPLWSMTFLLVPANSAGKIKEIL